MGRLFSTHIAHILLLAVAYVVFARLGQIFAIPPGNVTPVWIPSGIVLAAILLKGNYLWPGIFIGAFFGNAWAYYDYSTANNIYRSVVAAASNGTGDTIAAIFSAYFIKRMAGSSYPFCNSSDAFYFVLYGSILGGGISAVFGVTSLSLMGFVDWSGYLTVWITWWVGDCVGVLLITPVLLSYSHWKDWQWFSARSGLEILLFFLSLLLLSLLVVGGNFFSTTITLPIVFLLPLLLWSVFRFPDHVTFLAVLIMSILVIIEKSQFFGINSTEMNNISIVELQLSILVVSVTLLVLLASKKNKDQIEASLEMANKYNRSLFEGLPIGLVLFDMSGKVVDVNSVSASIVGRNIEEIKSLSLRDITSKEYFYHEIEQLEDDSSYGPYEKEFIHKDGRCVSVVFRSRAIDLDDVKYILSSVEDISGEKLAEENLIRTEGRYRALLDSAAEAVVIANRDGLILEMNKSSEKLFGYNAEDILGKNVSILVPDTSQRAHDGYISDFHRSGESQIVGVGREVEARRKNGALFPVHIAIGQCREHKDVSFMAIVRDLSEQKRHYKSLKKASEEAVNANLAKSEFLSSMSHELRTPLNAIIGFSQLLEMGKDKLSKDQLVSVNEIQRGGRHLLALINEILDLSKIESGKITIKMQKVSLKKIIDECLRLTSSHAKEQGVNVSVTKDAEFILCCDPLRFKQILLNYLSNAIKYNNKSGTVAVTYRKIVDETAGPEFLRVTVSDTGKGLSEKQMDSLFTPFERIGAENGSVQGTGLGLAISKKLALLMHGDVGVNSTLGEGSNFWVDILLADVDVESKELDAKKKNTESTESIVESSPLPLTMVAKILYVEDNESNIRFIKQAFNLYSDSYSLQACSDPHQGLALAIEDPPDLILLDISMPGMDGFEVLEQLRKDKATCKVPVIAISANAMERDIEKGMSAGFNGYLCKPVSISILMETVESILSY